MRTIQRAVLISLCMASTALQAQTSNLNTLIAEMNAACPVLWEDLGAPINAAPIPQNPWAGNQADADAFVAKYMADYSVTNAEANQVAATPTAVASYCGSYRVGVLDTLVANNSIDTIIATETAASPDSFVVQGGAPVASLVVASDGDIGVGTASPGQLAFGEQASVHVLRDDGHASILIEETNSSTAHRGMLELNNNGGSYMTLRNTATNEDWYVIHQHASPNRFIIADGVTDGAELMLSKSGDLTLQGSINAGSAPSTFGALVVDNSSVVTTYPDAALHVKEDETSFVRMLHLENTNALAGGVAFRMTNGLVAVDTNNVGGKYRINFDDGDAQELELSDGGDLTLQGGLLAKDITVEGAGHKLLQLKSTDGGSPQLRLVSDVVDNRRLVALNTAENLLTQIQLGDNDVKIFGATGSDANTMASFRTTGTTTRSLVVTNDLTYGMSTTAPEDVYIVDDGPARLALENTTAIESASTNQKWTINSNGTFRITGGIDAAEFVLDGAGNLTLLGTLVTAGTTCGGGCDAVFERGNNLPSIEEHAEEMWRNKHLPNVGPTIENEPINLTEKLGRMLNELETAHIYIAELHTQLKTKTNSSQQKIDQLTEIVNRLESRLNTIEK